MSQATRKTNESSESDSAIGSSGLTSSGGGSYTIPSFKTIASHDLAATSSGSENGANSKRPCQTSPIDAATELPSSSSVSSLSPSVSKFAIRLTNETKESNNLNNKSDEVIQKSQQETGQKCDTTTTSTTPRATTTTTTTRSRLSEDTFNYPVRPGSGRPQSMFVSAIGHGQMGPAQQQQQQASFGGASITSHLYPSTAHAPDRPTTASFSDIRLASSIGSSSAISSLNISTPLDRLSDCDAITRRLMSSPIRTVDLSERPIRRSQISEVDRSRRASLGTKSITEQVLLSETSQFNSLELSCSKASPDNGSSNSSDFTERRDAFNSGLARDDGQSSLRRGTDLKLKQQVRSLSVCQEEVLKSRFKNNNSNHSSNLNRAVSLACESGSQKRLLTIIPLFGCDMIALEQYMRTGLILPPPINSAIDHILTHGIDAVGIFRKSGVKSRILTLKKRIENNQAARVDEINVENEFSIYDIADLVKLWFRELKPSPIMTRDLIKRITLFLRSHGMLDEQKSFSQSNEEKSSSSSASMQDTRDRMIRQISSMISPAHRVLISRAMSFFATISAKSEVNQMTSQNLAICLTPSLCATETDQASILLAQQALKYCIDNHELWADTS